MSGKNPSRKDGLPGYHESLPDQLSKKKYGTKLELIEGTDPYEIPKKVWTDDVKLWPSVTHIDVGMYFLLSKCSYTEEELKKLQKFEVFSKLY